MTGLKEEIDSLALEAIGDKKAFKHVISLLYDMEMEKRLAAAKALGEIARIRPDIIRRRWDRIFYAFDDTMSCWGAAEALGEIGRNMPEIRGKILLLLRKFEKDETSCQGYIWAICRIAQVDMERALEFMPEIVGFINEKDACLKSQAIWASGELRIQDALESIEKNINDMREVKIYTSDSVEKTTISLLARKVLEEIKAQPLRR